LIWEFVPILEIKMISGRKIDFFDLDWSEDYFWYL